MPIFISMVLIPAATSFGKIGVDAIFKYKEKFHSFQGDNKYIDWDPLVLDLNDDGIKTININDKNNIVFDINGSGNKINTGWLDKNDGFLVFDKNNNGVIDDISEMFNNLNTENGFEHLKEFDTNNDNIIDKNDEHFTKLKIWKDLNQNGISEENEFFTLDELGIISINLNYQNVNINNNSNIISQTATFTTADGKEHIIADVNFVFDNFYRENVQLANDINHLLIPDVKGFGSVNDLRNAAILDESFFKNCNSVSKNK